ncbi:MAG: cell division protein FtsZ [Nanoarchaeota archaeon]|nr:cell division protein FtsZ [Nanoarchaeota archaeon]
MADERYNKENLYEEPELEDEEDISLDNQTDLNEYEEVEDLDMQGEEIRYKPLDQAPDIIKVGFAKEEVDNSAKDKRNLGFGKISAAELKQERQEKRTVYEQPYENTYASSYNDPSKTKSKSIRDHLEEEMKPIPRENILRKPINPQEQDKVARFENRPVERNFRDARDVRDMRNDPVSDSELKNMVLEHRAKIIVVGCGGAGNNTINRMSELGMGDIKTIAVNTDAQDLLYTNSDKKVLIGKILTKGLGAGAIPKVGEDAAKEAEAELKAVVQGADLVFITAGMGGGTGTGSAPVIADISRKMGALTVGIVTMPFTMEGARRKENARIGLEKLQQVCDTLIIIPNDKLLQISPDLPLHTAFKLADEILTNAVRGVSNLIIEPGLVNLDFADVKTVMSNAGLALIGVGESDTKQRAAEAVDRAMNNPLLDAEIAGATGALINISGGPDMTLDEARFIVEEIGSKLDDEARIIWGAQVLDDLQNTIRVLIIVTGVKSQQALSTTPKEVIAQRRKKEIENELGLEFV